MNHGARLVRPAHLARDSEKNEHCTQLLISVERLAQSDVRSSWSNWRVFEEGDNASTETGAITSRNLAQHDTQSCRTTRCRIQRWL